MAELREKLPTEHEINQCALGPSLGCVPVTRLELDIQVGSDPVVMDELIEIMTGCPVSKRLCDHQCMNLREMGKRFNSARLKSIK